MESSQSDERRLFCLEVVVDKCGEEGTEQLLARHRPKGRKAVDVKGVKDMDDLKRRLKTYLKEAQRNQFPLPKTSEYASRACAVRFLDYPLLIVDRAKVKAPPTVSEHPLRGVEVGVPFGQGKSCMFHTTARKLVSLLRDHPLHIAYLDLRRREEPKLVGTASLPLSDSIVLEQKGLHTHAPIYSITGERVGSIALYVRLSCHGSTLLRHLVNFRGISSPGPRSRVMAGEDGVANAAAEEGEEDAPARVVTIGGEEGKSPVVVPRPRPVSGAKGPRDLSSVRSFRQTKAAIYAAPRPPTLFYDPEMEVERPERPRETKVMVPGADGGHVETPSARGRYQNADANEDEDDSSSSSSSPSVREVAEVRPTGREPPSGGAPLKARPAAGRELRSSGVQANVTLDTHELIRELALEISNAIRQGANSMISQVGIRREDTFVAAAEAGEAEHAAAAAMPELELEVAEPASGEGLLDTTNVEDELEQLLQDLETKPIASIMYGDPGAALREELAREASAEASPDQRPPGPGPNSEGPRGTAPPRQEVPPALEESAGTPTVDDEEKGEGGKGNAEVGQISVLAGQERLVLSDPSEEPAAGADAGESSEEESYTPFGDDDDDDGDNGDAGALDAREDLKTESTLLEIDGGAQAAAEEEEEVRQAAPPAPPPGPPPVFDDGVQKTMTENPAMAAVSKVWEDEYGDVGDDLDAVLTEGSLDLLPSGTEAESYVIESDISEEISEAISEEEAGELPSETRQVALPHAAGGGDAKRGLTLFKSTKN